ncbi:c-type cytochrome [Candidatus Rariloculus sp.]|uniref:c-type cytochrome n=1 Tax=Candidatus Rariloculus sp. TaxID=3101265 RepID=UPI003D0F298C
MRQTIFLLSLLLAAASTAVLGQTGPSEANGKVVYDKWCIHCHGQMERGPLPGTAALSLKYRGELPAILEERTDLAPEFITTVVRGGLFGMPITRKTEVSAAELEDIIAYLTRSQAP